MTDSKPSLADRLAVQVTRRKKPEHIPEITRICQLPISFPLTEEEVEAVQQAHVKVGAYEDGFRLQRVQAEAIQIFDETGSLFGPIEVGGGKTLITLRCAGIAHEKGIRKILLVVPAQVFSQLMNHDVNWARARVPLGCQFHFLGGKSREERRRISNSNARGCFVVPYSLLSTEDTSDLLDTLAPGLVIFDEAHNLKNRKSARTRRVMSFMRKHRPQVVAVSGTMTSKSIRDYAHIIQLCLGAGSPLPLEAQVVADWSATIDASQSSYNTLSERHVGSGPLRPLVSWSNENFPHDRLSFDVEGFRRAFQNRLLTTPGVVASPADSLGVSLVMSNQRVKLDGEGSELLRELDRKVEEEWVLPNGDELEWAMHKFKARYELSAGFYNNLVWPQADEYAKRKKLSEPEARERLDRALQHHYLLQEYHRELREWLKYHQIPGCDTPMLVGRNMHEMQDRVVGGKLYKAWKRARDAAFEGMPERDSFPVRVCDYKIRAAVEWMKGRSSGILWYYHQAVGEWAFEMAKAAGINAIHCPAGKNYNDLLTAESAGIYFRDKFAICSITAHGTGKNLQYFDDQFCLQFPRPEETAQQMIGRTHRKGQQADEVNFTTCISSEIDEIALAATLNDAVYVFETTSSKRKVLFATWDPMPVIYGTALLNRAGAEAKQLNIRQRKILEDRFGQIKD